MGKGVDRPNEQFVIKIPRIKPSKFPDRLD